MERWGPLDVRGVVAGTSLAKEFPVDVLWSGARFNQYHHRDLDPWGNPYAEVTAALREIAAWPELENCRDGLCWLMVRSPRANPLRALTRGCWESNRKKCFRDWPLFSGSTSFPVPDPDGAKLAFFRNEFKWSKTTVYGVARWDLLYYCIAWFDAKARED